MSAGLTVEISRNSDGWKAALPGAPAVLRQAAESAWRAAPDASGAAEVSIALADDALLRRLNRQYRGKDGATNVLSFPAGDVGAPGRARLLGDIVLALETAQREAGERSISLADHVSHLTVHGMLHLLGRDHDNDREAAAMEALETEILAGLGVADPYAGTGEIAEQA